MHVLSKAHKQLTHLTWLVSQADRKRWAVRTLSICLTPPITTSHAAAAAPPPPTRITLSLRGAMLGLVQRGASAQRHKRPLHAGCRTTSS